MPLHFEHFSEPLLSRALWLRRILRSSWLALLLVLLALAMGVAGYHGVGGLSWIDALLEASMILGGMGAVAPMANDGVKLFASFYALFSGFVMMTTMAIILAPFVHRLLHRLHGPEPKKKERGVAGERSAVD